jgi:hypothetical protein
MKKITILILALVLALPQSAAAAVGYRTGSASAKVNSTGAAVTPDLPTGVAANDIVILVGTTIAGGSVTITDSGSVNGWNALTGSPIDVTGGEKLYVWWGRYTSGSTGPELQPAGDHIVAATFAYSGAFTNASPIDVSTTGSETTSDTSFSFATGISSTVNDTIVLVVYTSGADSNTGQAGTTANTSLTSVTGSTPRAEYNTNNGGGGGFVVADGMRAVAGTLGTWTDTMGGATPKAYITFNLKPVIAPTVTTQDASGVGMTSATLNGTVTNHGGDDASQHGFAWGTSATMVGDTATTTGGAFAGTTFTNSSLTLVCGTTYYSRAYATNSIGTAYGAISSSFATSACIVDPTVTTDSADTFTLTSARVIGSVTAESATTCGFAWGTGATLSGGDTATTSDSTCPATTGTFEKTLSGLTTNQTYYYRAYGTLSGSGYGDILNFMLESDSATPARKMRLFEGFKLKLIGGRIKIL